MMLTHSMCISRYALKDTLQEKLFGKQACVDSSLVPGSAPWTSAAANDSTCKASMCVMCGFTVDWEPHLAYATVKAFSFPEERHTWGNASAFSCKQARCRGVCECRVFERATSICCKLRGHSVYEAGLHFLSPRGILHASLCPTQPTLQTSKIFPCQLQGAASHCQSSRFWSSISRWTFVTEIPMHTSTCT